MLDTLKIKNLALIKDLEIEFSEGLNIITGETGAGKSIIVNSLQLILGKRASIDIIRDGEERCEVEAVFDLDNYEDYILVKRILTRNKKNKIKINNEFKTLSELRKFTEGLIDFSAQNQYLFDSENQLKIYDSFCGLTEKVKEFLDLFERYNNLKKSLLKKEERIQQIKDRIIILNHQLKELSELNLEEVDENQLKSDIEYYENIEKIKECLNFSIEILNNSDDFSIKNQIQKLKEKFVEIANLKDSFGEILTILEGVDVQLNEIVNTCLKEISSLPDDDSTYNRLIEFEEKINFLKRKHNKNSVEELIKFKKGIENELKDLENFEILMEEDKKELFSLEKRLNEIANILHKERLKYKENFEKEIVRILKVLKMDNVKFYIKIEELEKFNAFGRDKIEFLVSTNIGERAKPISEIASGGEKSRIMLALKCFLSDFLNIPVLVFDEIDAGTGGETAFAIGKLLKKISERHQVFVITHFPQVAAFADSHYKVFKITEGNRTITKIKRLSLNERIEELSRMIAGTVSERTKMSAEELINEAKKSYS